MKQLLLITIGLLFFGISSAANDSIPRFVSRLNPGELGSLKCDACGSATGGSMGFSSMLNSNFIGVRYFYQRYSSRDGIFSNSPRINENFNTIQLWTRIPVTRNVQVSAFIPYHLHDRALSSGQDLIRGLGDITVLAMFNLYSTRKDSVPLEHKLQLGGGIKIPTGEFRSSNNEGSVNPGFQLGSGSWDYLIAAEYTLKHKKAGMNAMANYNVKTANEKEYKFGNQLNYGSTLFYLFNIDKLKLMPQAGVAGEVYASNRQHGQYVNDTSGDIIFSKFGFEAGLQKFSFGINAMLPINQNLTGGNVAAKHRWSINLNYSL